VAVHIYTQTIHRTTQITTNVEECGRVRAVSRLCEFYPGICLTTEEKSRKNLSKGKKNLSQVKKNLSQGAVLHITKTPTLYKTHTNTHITKRAPSRARRARAHTHTHTHITKQYKITTVRIKTNTELKPNTEYKFYTRQTHLYANWMQYCALK